MQNDGAAAVYSQLSSHLACHPCSRPAALSEAFTGCPPSPPWPLLNHPHPQELDPRPPQPDCSNPIQSTKSPTSSSLPGTPSAWSDRSLPDPSPPGLIPTPRTLWIRGTPAPFSNWRRYQTVQLPIQRFPANYSFIARGGDICNCTVLAHPNLLRVLPLIIALPGLQRTKPPNGRARGAEGDPP